MSSIMEAAFKFFDDAHSLTKLTIIDFGIQWGLWGVASLLKTEKFYDLAGTSTFILVSALNYKWHGGSFSTNPRAYIQTGCVLVWACRLGTFLFSRIIQDGHDRRFKEALEKPSLLFVFWTMQALWVIISLLPTLLTVMSPRQQPLGWRDYIGWGFWTFGFVFESIADYQKRAFRKNPANKDKFISTGLWSLSRHPNYFGEILLWFGLYISASSNFSRYQYLSIFCPMLEYLLITRISGVPALEKIGIKRWGKNPMYQDYLKNTPVLVPFFHF